MKKSVEVSSIGWFDGGGGGGERAADRRSSSLGVTGMERIRNEC